MTQKELLYFEDAINHESIISSILEDMVNKLEDEQLVSFISEEKNKHDSTKERLMSLLKEKQDE